MRRSSAGRWTTAWPARASRRRPIWSRSASTVGARLSIRIRIARKIVAQAPFAPHLDREVDPGPEAETDGALEAFIRRTVGTLFHPVGTCAMGRTADSVVDPETLRVHGVDGLRVIDASIMPAIVSGNTNAPAIMIGERAAEFIRGSAPAGVA